MNAMRSIATVALACACAGVAHAAPPKDFARRVDEEIARHTPEDASWR